MSEKVLPESYWLNEFIEAHKPAPFRPIAYYDKHLDCIRVELRACSVTEHRCGQFFTLLEDNNPEADQTRFIGFTIKGVWHLFAELGLPLTGVQEVVAILNALLEKYTQELAPAEKGLAEIRPILRDTELKIDFAQAA
ncbi:MAG: hypothetical protein HYW07_16945 [Candidatus Latescibacteria bacterium]|nr:hypothetical protein [Candidatus Latescibacterota bacterium]